MFRVAVSRVPLRAHQRNFVSSVLLTRTWENETVAELRRETRIRGLSPKGNKASLILKIQDHDRTKTFDAIAPRSPSDPVRAQDMSTVAAGHESIAPGIPLASQATRPLPKVFMNTNMPDISQPDPEPPIQIPYVPDFWDSFVPAPKGHEVEEPLPKLLVVAGADTHPGGGPSHNLHDANASTEPTENDVSNKPTSTQQGQGGLWDDIAEDLGIPPPVKMKSVFQKLLQG